MDDLQRRILEDLTGLIRGEIRCDPLTVSMYASDGSLYQVRPLGVVWPRNRDDVVLVARYAAEKNVPLVARGAGTSVAGCPLGPGLIVDFSRYMRRILHIGDSTVRVEPGVVLDRLNRELRSVGRYFPPDPAGAEVMTVGGMLGVDAAGSHAVRVGSTRDHVASIEVVLAGGAVFEAGEEPLSQLRTPPEALAETALASPTPEDAGRQAKRTIISKLAKLLADHAGTIRERQPPLIRNTSGYHLRSLLAGERLSLPRLLVGSEGTLGLFTAATLHTLPLPAHRGVVLMLFGQLEGAIRSVQALEPLEPSACDLLDRRILSLAREADERFARLISPAAEAALLVEQIGFSERQVRERLRAAVEAVHAVNLRAVVACQAWTDDEVDFLWSLPGRVVPLLTRLPGRTRPQPFVEDIAVPPPALYDFLVRAQKVFQKHAVTASLYAHAASGQVHLRPFLASPEPQDGPRLEDIARDLYQVTFSVGGTISGEHGDGLSRTAFIRSQYGPLYRVFQQVKDLFDPHNLLNPGKIVSDDPHVTAKNFRPLLGNGSRATGATPLGTGGPATSATTPPVELQLKWKPEELFDAAARCNGCGLCRTQAPELRMCPFFRIDAIEEASPRSKANVVRNLLSAELGTENLTSPEMKRLTGLCFNCKQCRLECPSNVNIPQMMIEAKAAYVAAHGLSRADWILSRAHSFGALGSAASLAANWVIGSPTARWILEKMLGIARQRKLPRFARRSFLRTFAREAPRAARGGKGQPPVVYFVGEYANYYDPQLAQAFVAILRHHGIPVVVPPGQTTSGMAMISAGDLESAREVAERNVRELVEYAREGSPIVCTEPAAALCLKHEYPMLLDHPDVEVVAAQTHEAGDFLSRLHAEGRLRTDFAPLDMGIGYHTPCHLKALGRGTPLADLLSLIPSLSVRRIDEGCSGMAGAFGLTRENFRTSIRIGWPLISRMRSGEISLGATECTSCKLQMEQGTTAPTIHPLKLLALAYGLMPEIRAKLAPSRRKLVVT
ncbi:MAG: anaerobic glycerol-3-phosphate dehydrogenase subunit C [Planctomycetes bacterium]|nr:anaerobic glycerol-3-phosphate dehydrogenase subunit C [Planctomycetota bacterium]